MSQYFTKRAFENILILIEFLEFLYDTSHYFVQAHAPVCVYIFNFYLIRANKLHLISHSLKKPTTQK